MFLKLCDSCKRFMVKSLGSFKINHLTRFFLKKILPLFVSLLFLFLIVVVKIRVLCLDIFPYSIQLFILLMIFIPVFVYASSEFCEQIHDCYFSFKVLNIILFALTMDNSHGINNFWEDLLSWLFVLCVFLWWNLSIWSWTIDCVLWYWYLSLTTLLSWCLDLYLLVTELGRFWFSLVKIEAKFCSYSMVMSAQDNRGGPGLLWKSTASDFKSRQSVLQTGSWFKFSEF